MRILLENIVESLENFREYSLLNLKRYQVNKKGWLKRHVIPLPYYYLWLPSKVVDYA